MKRTGLTLIMHACQRCGGAAYLEDPREGDWRCLQCGRTIPLQQVEVPQVTAAKERSAA